MTRGSDVLPAAVVAALAAAVLGAAYVVPFLLSPVEGDLARDLYHGYRIATGQEWFAIGPRIGVGWHLGPAWYYLLALPMFALGSVTAAVSWVGLLASLKFLLAYRLGREVLDARFGVAWAILLALPGLSSFESIWVAHPSLVGTASLAVVYALWRALTLRSDPWMYAACLGFGLALHAHPTTLPLGVLLALVFVRLSTPRVRSWLRRLVLCTGLTLLPFTPLLADAQAQARDFLDLLRDVGAASAHWRAGDAVAVAANVLWHTPNLVVSTYLGDSRAIVAVWKAFVAALHATVLLGLAVALWRPDLGLRRMAAGGLAYALINWLVVVAVRSETRFYMLYALLPTVAFLQAVGITACARSGWRGLRRLADILLAATVVAFAAVAGARIAEAAQGYVRLPALFGEQMDLRSPRESGFAQLDSLPLWRLDAIGQTLCAAGNVHAFGDLAVVVDSQFNVPARLHCGERSRVTLGGMPGPGEAALFLLPGAGLDNDRSTLRLGTLQLGAVATIPYAGRGIPLASGDHYPARSRCAPPSTHAIDFVAGGDRTVVIATSLPGHCPIRVHRLTVDGLAVTPTRHSLAYFARAPEAGASSKWHLEVETGDVGAVQVFTLAPGAPAR
jgi:hypothetical protein